MPVEKSELARLAAGQVPHIYVGNLPFEIASLHGCVPGTVYLGHEVYEHIRREHGSIITDEMMQHLPLALRFGAYYLDYERPSCLAVFYIDRYTERRFLLPLKSCQHGGEVWIRTFYPLTKRKMESKIRRYKFLYQQL